MLRDFRNRVFHIFPHCRNPRGRYTAEACIKCKCNQRGKPSFTRQQVDTVRDLLSKETQIAEVARVTGLSRQTVYRIKHDPEGTEKALALWG
ncbi:helix-turn-helix domain-containing protein [Agrobacterium tumefaciens]